MHAAMQPRDLNPMPSQWHRLTTSHATLSLQLVACSRSLGMASTLAAHEWRHLVQCARCMVAGLPPCNRSRDVAPAPWATTLAKEVVQARVVPELCAMLERVKGAHAQHAQQSGPDAAGSCCYATMGAPDSTFMVPAPEMLLPARQAPSTTDNTSIASSARVSAGDHDRPRGRGLYRACCVA